MMISKSFLPSILFFLCALLMNQQGFGQTAGALNFGQDPMPDSDRMVMTNLTGFDPTAFTIEARIKVVAGPGQYHLVFHIGTTSKSDLEIYTQGLTNMIVAFNRSNGSPTKTVGFNSFPVDEWFLLTVAYDESTGLKMYYDGVEAPQFTSGAPMSGLVISSGAYVQIGSMIANSWAFTQGRPVRWMDELRIWDSKLPQSQIEQRIACEVASSTSGLYAHYTFNEGIAGGDNTANTTVFDYTGNGHNMTMVNFAFTGATSNRVEGSPFSGIVCAALPEGCTDMNACNYDPLAEVDNGSCLLVGASCDDGDNCTENDIVDASCGCAGTPINVDDGIDCTIDYCDNGVVMHDIDPTYCVSNDPCVSTECDVLLGCIFTALPDADGDGVCDAIDNCVDVSNADQFDQDNDGLGDVCDPCASSLVNIAGCTDVQAINYNSEAGCEDGSCAYAATGLNFDGVNDYISIPTGPETAFAAGDFTVEVNVRFDQASAVAGIITAFSGTGGWAIHQNGSQVSFIVGNSTATGSFESISAPIVPNVWLRLTCVRESSVIKLYVDGQLVNSTASARNIFNVITVIGRRYVDQPMWYFDGALDEVRIWKRALGADEINNRLNCEPVGDEQDLIRYLRFSHGVADGDNAGLTVVPNEATSYAVDATLFNFALNGSTSNWTTGITNNGPCLPPVEGCTDENACNYNALAVNDDGSCTYPTLGFDCAGNCVDWVTVTIDGGSFPADMAGVYIASSDCTTDEGGAWIGGVDYSQCFRHSDGSSWRIWNTGCGWEIGRIEFDGLYESWQRYARYYTGYCNEIPAEQLGFEALTTSVFFDGFGQPLSGLTTVLNSFTGCTDVNACNYDPAAVCDDGSCELPDGCTDPLACNFNPSALCDDGSCVLPNGCTDVNACNYDAMATCDDGSCVLPDGCTNSAACNFNPSALCDDGSCVLPNGCTDVNACNYDAMATCDDGSCEYTSCLGCTDVNSCDYNAEATVDDGSCLVYPGSPCDDGNAYTENDLVLSTCDCAGSPIDTDQDGLSDQEEIEVYFTNPAVQDTDGDGLTDTLEVELSWTNPTLPDTDGDGCNDALEFSGQCGESNTCIGDLNNDGLVNGGDLLMFLGSFGTSCN